MKECFSKPDISEEVLKQVFNDEKFEGLTIPPKCHFLLGGKTVEYINRKSLSKIFTVKPEFTNPINILQGGILVAFMDDTIGPLSYAIAKAPIVTTALNINYVRSVGENQKVLVIAEAITVSPINIFFEAKAFDEKGKLVASMTSQNLILKRNKN